MNGCLFKILLIMAALMGLFMAFPYLKQYTTGATQAKLYQIENTATIIGKFVRQMTNQKINEDKKNEQKHDLKNQETGK